MTHILNDVDKACHKLLLGQLLAYPTESVWGIGCDPFNASAFQQLLYLKNRPQAKGVILVGADASHFATILKQLSQTAQDKMLASWRSNKDQQQAITWLVPVLPAMNIPSWITGQHSSVAIRVSPHPLVKQLCNAFGGMLVSTSCNTATQPPAKTLSQAYDYFLDDVFYLAGDTLGYQQPSQIIDLTSGKVLR